MPVPTVIGDLSTTIASNSPAGSESAAATDDYLRAHAGFIAQLYAGTTAGQVVFPATQNPSSNVNTLDDYEEGTFTPTDASGAGLTLTVAVGQYVKIGRAVHVWARVQYPSTADASNAILGGLPFTSANPANQLYFSLALSYPPAAGVVTGAMVGSNGTNVYLFDGTGQPSNATMSGRTIYFGGSYLAVG